MKILHIINSLDTGGAEKMLTELVPLQSKFISVDVLLLTKKQSSFLESLKKSNIKCFFIGEGSLYNPIIAIKLIKYFNKYDLIHVHLFPSQYWVIIAKVLSFSKVKIITTEHSTSNRRRKKRIFRFLDKIIYSIYDRIVSVSFNTNKQLISYLKPRDRSKYIYINNGIDISKYRDSKSYAKADLNSSLLEEDIIVTQVSSFGLAKDQDTVIKAISLLSPNFKLILVGDGLRRKECEKLVKKMNLESRVFFLGIRSDIPQILQTSDIVVLSSHWEGFGLAAVEGMAARKPVIGSAVPGLQEVLIGAGVLFQSGNYKELAGITKKLGADVEYRKKIKDSCFLRAQEYNINVTVKKYLDLYNSLLKK